MRAFAAALLMLPYATAVGNPIHDILELDETGKMHAHQFIDEMEQTKGSPLTSEDVDRLRPLIDSYYRALNDPKSETSKPLERVKIVRDFVKRVGPVLGKDDHAADGPLHTVYERARHILGAAPPEDKLHPHLEARRLISAMVLFMKTAVAAIEQLVQKDEL